MTHTDDYPQDVTNLPHEDATQGAGAGRAINQTWEELREGESEDAALGQLLGEHGFRLQTIAGDSWLPGQAIPEHNLWAIRSGA